MPRVVLDPNVLISALITPEGASAQLLVALREGAFELVVSPHLLDELRKTLGRDKFRRYVSPTQVGEFIELLRRIAIAVDDPTPPAVGLSEDPDDEYLITLARSARVDRLVSGDPHVLRLRSRLPVCSPREVLDQIVERTS